MSSTNGKAGIHVVGVEIWRPIPGWPRYEASSEARIRGGYGRGKVLKQGSNGRYRAVRLGPASDNRLVLVHTLVALAFHGEPPGEIGRGIDDWQVNHIDGDRLNNLPSNLEWVTHRENKRHASETGLLCTGERHGLTTLTDPQVLDIRKRYAAGGVRQRDLANEYGVAQSTVSRIINRVHWQEVA